MGCDVIAAVIICMPLCNGLLSATKGMLSQLLATVQIAFKVRLYLTDFDESRAGGLFVGNPLDDGIDVFINLFQQCQG